MIRTMFLGKQAYDKAERGGEVPASVTSALQTLTGQIEAELAACPDLAKAGFGAAARAHEVVQSRIGEDFWFRGQPAIAAAIARIGKAAATTIATLSPAELLQLDHACVRNGSVPAYLGGASGLATLHC